MINSSIIDLCSVKRDLLNAVNVLENVSNSPILSYSDLFEDQLIHTKSSLIQCNCNFAQYFQRLNSLIGDLEMVQCSKIQSIDEDHLRQSIGSEFDRKYVALIGRMFKGLQQGLFSRVQDRSLLTEELTKLIYDFINHYDTLTVAYSELTGRHEALVLTHRNCADFVQKEQCKSVNNEQLLDQTAVFELIESETNGSVKDLEDERLKCKKQLDTWQIEWECERQKLSTSLKLAEGQWYLKKNPYLTVCCEFLTANIVCIMYIIIITQLLC